MRSGLVPEIRPQPTLDLVERHVLARRVVLDLVAADAADREIARLRMREVDAADARARHHRERLGERDPDLLGAEQVEELALLGVVGAGRIAERRADAAELLGTQLLRRQLLAALVPLAARALVQ